MSRGTLVVIFAAVAVLAVAVALGRAPEQPSGPAGSSYATTPGGLAAYATLLERAGHDVRRVRAPLDERKPSVGETVVVVDGTPLPAAERDALTAQVRAGGRAVLAGTAARGFSGAARGRAVGRGTIVIVPDATALRNRALDQGDNAARALALAGPPSRRIAFVESVHGYHEQRGLSALPDAVITCLWLLGLAALAFLVVMGRRLGPPEDAARDLAPPRRAHVEALAAALARTKDKDTILHPDTESEPT
ncbi:MAG TPA: DUF4350 domain-containing protein [Baekduia sp.]|nr:DUF4350 domain-containing protein [Baekduia sp.]